MFRKPTKKKVVQARQRTDEDEGEDVGSVIKDSLSRKRRNNPMVQSTKKRNRDGDDLTSSSDEDGPTSSTIVVEHSFAASGSAAPLGPADQGATATLEIDTEVAADGQSQFERVQQQLREGVEKDGKVLYKGQAMYGAKQAKDTVKGNASSGANRVGPVRAPQFLRQTVRWDFAPDICKDYKETGFCTFGDSCKFLHDRSDYKHGWEIERDFQSGRLGQVDDTNYEINDDGDQLPDDCFICGNEFDTPVVTRCKHYFCESCAVAAFRKSKKCQVCNENTGGVFNVAKEIIQKMAGIKKRGAKEEEPESEDDELEEVIKEEPADDSHSHVHDAGCSHHGIVNEIKEEQESDEGADDNDNDNVDITDEPEQGAVDIKMEEIESDDNNSDGGDDSDNEDEDEET